MSPSIIFLLLQPPSPDKNLDPILIFVFFFWRILILHSNQGMLEWNLLTRILPQYHLKKLDPSPYLMWGILWYGNGPTANHYQGELPLHEESLHADKNKWDPILTLKSTNWTRKMRATDYWDQSFIALIFQMTNMDIGADMSFRSTGPFFSLDFHAV